VSYGYVTWDDGEPAEGAQLQLLLVQRQEEMERRWIDAGTRTDAQGYYELERREVCPLRLAAQVPGRGRGEETAAPLGPDEEIPFRIRRDLVLDKALAVHGIVWDERGSTIGHGTIEATPRMKHARDSRGLPILGDTDGRDEQMARLGAYQAAIRADGTFEFPAMDINHWTFRAKCEGYQDSRERISQETILSEQLIEITVKDPQCVDVFVVDTQGQGVPAEVKHGAWAIMVGPDDVYPTDANGQVRICDEVDSGTSLSACADGLDCRVVRVEDTDDDVVIALEESGRIRIQAMVEESEGDVVISFTAYKNNDHAHSVIPANEVVEFTRAPLGTTTMHLRAVHGDGQWKGEITVEPGQVLDMGQLRLEPSDREAREDSSVWNPARL